MASDERAPPKLHRGFLGLNHLAYKLRKAANKVTFERDVYAGFEIMIQGKTSRSWMSNLLTLMVGPDSRPQGWRRTMATGPRGPVASTKVLAFPCFALVCFGRNDPPQLAAALPRCRAAKFGRRVETMKVRS